jgi:hypothetical protein
VISLQDLPITKGVQDAARIVRPPQRRPCPGRSRVIDPKLTNPTTFDWEQSFALCRLIF